MTIKGLLRKVESMNTDKVIDSAFDQTLTDLVGLNQDRMLAGVRSDGSEMPHYSNRSVTEFGKEPGPIRLFDTGIFQESISVKRSGNVLTTISTDSKNDMLVKEYGPEIFGTGGVYKKQYIRENLRPALNKEINLITGLRFGK